LTNNWNVFWIGVSCNKRLTTGYKQSKRLHSKNRTNTKDLDWVTGVVDAKGTFWFGRSKNGKWYFTFQVANNRYNLRLLYRLAKVLGTGYKSVYVPTTGEARLRIRDGKTLLNVILPVFDRTPGLLTYKYYQYLRFREALIVYMDSSLSKADKDLRLTALLQQNLEALTIKSCSWLCPPPVWTNINLEYFEDVKSVISPEWLLGYFEVKASFYLRLEWDSSWYVPTFGITTTSVPWILEAINTFLFLGGSIKFVNSTGLYILEESNEVNLYRSVYLFLIKFPMQGMKQVEFRVWSKDFKRFGDRLLHLAGSTHTNSIIPQRLKELKTLRPNPNLWRNYYY